jgi:hypothetical protein
MVDFYTLDDHGQPVPCADVLQWGRWMESATRIVARTTINEEVEVSTVFLGIDHAFLGGPPVLWETMVFGGEHDMFQRRYTSLDEAQKGHDETVAMASEPARTRAIDFEEET